MIKKLINKFFSLKNIEKEIECTIDEDPVDCEDLEDEGLAFKQDAINYYTGVPAPPYLKEDHWFGPPVITTKGLDYMEQELEIKRQERKENFSVEPDNIHQEMYEIATKTQSTTLHLDPIGGSENFQGGSENVHK